MPDSSHDDLDANLRNLAKGTHPRPAFVARLRGELNRDPARKPWPAFLAWARPYAAQMAVVLALVGLVTLALALTPHLLNRGQAGGGPAGGPTGAPFPPAGQPTASGILPTATPIMTRLYPNALARMGKGTILWMDAAADGRLAVASSASLCVYKNDMSEDWCLWPSRPAVLVAFDPTGAFLVVKFSDGMIWRVDAANGEPRGSFQSYTGPAAVIGDVDWDPTGAPRIAIAEQETEQSPAPTATGDPYVPPAEPQVQATQPAPGKTITHIAVYDWDKKAPAWDPVTIQGWVRAVVWAKGKGGESLLAAGGEYGIVLFDGETGAVIQKLEPTWQAAPMGRITSMAFSPDGSWLVYGYENGMAALETQGGKFAGQTRMWTLPAAPTRLAWGSAIAADVSGILQVYTLDGKEPRASLQAGTTAAPAWSADGRSLYHSAEYGGLSVYTENEDLALLSDYATAQRALVWKDQNTLIGAGRALYTWGVANQAVSLVQLATPPGESTSQPFLAIAPDGQWALTQGNVLFDTASSEPKTRLEPGFTNDKAAFSPDGKRVALGSPDGRVVVYSAETGQQDLDVQAIPAGTHLTGLAWGASLGPESDPIAVTWQRTVPKPDGSTGGGVHILNASGLGKGQSGLLMEHTIKNYINYLELPTFSEDGKLLAVSDVANQVFVLSMEDSRERYTLDTPAAVSALAFSPDGQFLVGAAGSWGFITWDMSTGQQASRFGGLSRKVNAIAFSPDGKIIASASIDGTISLWDASVRWLPLPYPAPVSQTPPANPPEPTKPGLPSATPLPPTRAPTATPFQGTPFLGTPQAQGNGVISGWILMGYGRHEPVQGEKIYIIDPPQPGGGTDPLSVTDADGRFSISNIAPGHYLFAARHLQFSVDVPEQGGTVELGLLRYPLIHPPSYYRETPQPVDLAKLLEGQPISHTILYQDAAWTPPSEAEQREKVWSWAINDEAIANQGGGAVNGEGLLGAYFNRPAFVYDSMDIFNQTHPQAPDAGTPGANLPGEDYRLLIGLWNRPSFLNVESYSPDVLDDLFNRRQVEAWLMGYALDDGPQSLLKTGDGAGGFHYTLKVHPAQGFQVIRFMGSGVPDGTGVMQVHLVSGGQEINPERPPVATGPDDSQQAAQVARDFLTYLNEGKNDRAKYDNAFDLYGRSPTSGFQGETTKAKDRLHKACEDPDESKRFYCLPILQMSPAERISPDHYRVWAQFAGADGAVWVAPNNRQQWFDFDVLRGADGRLRVVTDPPTWTGFRDINAFMPETDLAGLDDAGKVRALLEDFLSRCEAPYMADTERISDYQITKATAYDVAFDVKPDGAMDTTFWIAAMGRVEGPWIRGKISNVSLVKEGNFYYLNLVGNG